MNDLSTQLSNTFNSVLSRLINENKEKDLLLISQNNVFNADVTNVAPHLKIYTDLTSFSTDDPNQHWYLGIVICQDDDTALEQSLARMRDVQCERTYLAYCNTLNTEQDTQIRSLGFKRITLNQQTTEQQKEHLYYFDIFDYKEIPEWLNNRFWSNPDMWDKARW